MPQTELNIGGAKNQPVFIAIVEEDVANQGLRSGEVRSASLAVDVVDVTVDPMRPKDALWATCLLRVLAREVR